VPCYDDKAVVKDIEDKKKKGKRKNRPSTAGSVMPTDIFREDIDDDDNDISHMNSMSGIEVTHYIEE